MDSEIAKKTVHLTPIYRSKLPQKFLRWIFVRFVVFIDQLFFISSQVEDQTQIELWPDYPDWNDLWSDKTKITSNQTIPRLWSRLYCAYDLTQFQSIVQTINRLWSDLWQRTDQSFQTEVTSDQRLYLNTQETLNTLKYMHFVKTNVSCRNFN